MLLHSDTLCAVDRVFEPQSGQTKDYNKIGICCFSAKQAALRRKSKDWLARNQNNVSEWSDEIIFWRFDSSGSRNIRLLDNFPPKKLYVLSLLQYKPKLSERVRNFSHWNNSSRVDISLHSDTLNVKIWFHTEQQNTCLICFMGPLCTWIIVLKPNYCCPIGQIELPSEFF
jgi:hypothetical protein